MLIFLDFDGVLHPVRLPIGWIENLARLRADGVLLQHLPALTAVLAKHDDVQVVVSSSWRTLFSQEQLVDILGPLGATVVGTTGKTAGTRYQDIESYLTRTWHQGEWLAIDDDNRGWPEDLLANLVLCNPLTGIDSGQLRHLDDLLGERKARDPASP